MRSFILNFIFMSINSSVHQSFMQKRCSWVQDTEEVLQYLFCNLTFLSCSYLHNFVNDFFCYLTELPWRGVMSTNWFTCHDEMMVIRRCVQNCDLEGKMPITWNRMVGGGLGWRSWNTDTRDLRRVDDGNFLEYQVCNTMNQVYCSNIWLTVKICFVFSKFGSMDLLRWCIINFPTFTVAISTQIQ